MSKLHIKKGDTVYVNAGEDKGKTGRVLRVLVKEQRAVVEGINMVSKHTKPNAKHPQGGIITMEEYGNVRLKLKERMDSDGINRNTLARRIGVRFEVVDKWYRGDVEKLDLDILARICCVLHCTVGDLLEYHR